MTNAHDFTATSIDGDPQPLSDYQGKVMLIVNTASRCGNTPQYEGLEHLHEKYADRGLVVLGFPCGQFGDKEPGDEAEIQQFCSREYDVTFPMFAKTQVNGTSAHPLYQVLKSEAPGLLGTPAIKWNFTKFLIDKEGRVVKRYAPTLRPEVLARDIEPLLA